jgi:acyl carrier protein
MNDLADSRDAAPNLRERLIALVRKILGPPAAARPLPIDARLSDLGMSSLKMVNLMLAMEVQFDLAIPQAEITPENFASIASVEALIAKLQSAPPA